MNCAICFDKIKAEMGGKKSNWTQKCITCKDSWVCGSCYNNWDLTFDNNECYKVMPCVFCKEPMYYSKLVRSFNEGTGAGWWDEKGGGGSGETKPVFEILWRIYEEEKEDN